MDHIEQKSEEVSENLQLQARRLRSPNPYRRKRARKLLREAGQEAVEPLLALVEEERHIYRSRRVWRFFLNTFTAGGYIGWLWAIARNPYIWPLGLIPFLSFSAEICLRVATRAQTEAAQILAD